MEEGSKDAQVQIDMQLLKDQIRDLTRSHPIYSGKQKADVIHIQELDNASIKSRKPQN